MNKKFSTLLAAFLAAGYCMTAEAGVVKITKVESGNAYVVGEDAWTTAKAYLKSSSSTVVADNSKAANAFGVTEVAAGQWTLLKQNDGTYLLKQGNNYLRQNDVTSSVAELGTTGTKLVMLEGTAAGTYKLAVASNPSQILTLATSTATFGAGSDIAFYAYTKKINEGKDQVLKIGNEYLVLDENDKVALVNETEYQAYLTLNKVERTLWNIAADGKITTQVAKNKSGSSLADNALNVDASGSGVFAIGVAGSATVFEYNEAEGLTVAWSTNTANYLVKRAGDYKLVSSLNAGESCVKIQNATSSVAPFYANPAADTYVLTDKVDGNEYYMISSNVNTKAIATPEYIYQASDVAAPELKSNSDLNSDALKKGAYWKVSESFKDGKWHYTFKNKNDITLKVDGISEFVSSIRYARGVMFDGNITGKTLQMTASKISFETAEVSPTAGEENGVFGFYKLSTEDFKANELLEAYNTYFDLTLSNKKDGATLTGNPFADQGLVPMKIVWDQYNNRFVLREATGSEKVFLLKKKVDGDYIVLDFDKKWSKEGINIHVTSGGYKFATLTEDNMLAFINQNGNAELIKRNLGFAFQFTHATLETEIKDITVVDYPAATENLAGALAAKDQVKVTADDRISAKIVTLPVYLTSYETDGVNYLTVNADQTKVILYASLAKPTLVHGSDAKNNPLNYGYVNIEFVNHEKVTYQTEDNKTAYLNGKVLGIRRGQNGVIPAEADKFLFAKPEGQWFVKMTNVSEAEAKDGKALPADKDIQFSFVNRENPEIVYYVDKMFALGDDTYAIQSEVITPIFNNNSAIAGVRRDTVKITNANIKNNVLLTDGYKDLNDAAIKDKQYRIVLNSTSDVNYYVSENHTGNHLLGITTKEAEAATWKLVRMDREAQYDKDGYLKEATDSIYVINKPQVYKSDKKYYQYTDTLAAVTYALKNTVSNEYLTYADIAQEKDINAMICKENSADYLTHRDDTYKAWLNSNYRFIIKEKDGELVNILGVNQSERNHRINFGNKLFGASTNNRVEIETAYTQINSNDLFRLEEVNAPEYVKSAQGEVIRLFSEDNNNDVIYENGEFLNLGNITQITDMKPALYVDTAYVERDGNNRYQYLLVVNPTRVDEVLDNANHQIHPDTTYGRFLVNLVDTAVYAYKNGAVHANKYINDKEAGEKLVKTGFVWGFRTADKLYVTKDNTFKKDDARVIDLSTSDFNVAKFAFQYVNSTNADDKSFKIQTRYVDYASAIKVKDQKDREESNDGYLKTINGVVVVANGYAKGEVFNLSAEASDPTANDEITASSVTVEGGNGIVTIKGAAAKKVTVCNVLGQTLATTVLTSDEATIAVPAGIVVVAVEGEAAVKAVVK